MNARNTMKSNSYDRRVDHRQIDVAAKSDRSSNITGADAKFVMGAFMPRKPAFSTAC
jgi:hypothetical protein